MSSITRRRFLEGTAATTVIAGTPLGKILATPKPDIVDVSGTEPHKMVEAALKALGGMEKIVKKGDYVVLKPNSAFANPPEWGTTTHPQTVVAVAKACFKAGAKRVTIVEFPQAKGQKCLDRCGLTEAIKAVPKATVKLLAGKRDFKKTKIKDAVVLKDDYVPYVAKVVKSADVYINIPAAKAHTATGVSFGLKNAMGIIYDRLSFHNVFDLHQGIADLGRIIKPQLTILDGTRALLTNGPKGPGETAKPNRMIAGFNVVSVDAYGLKIARFNNRQLTPADVKHIKLAANAVLGQADTTKLNIIEVKT